MILSPEYLKQLRNNQLKNHVNKLVKMQQAYFGLETLQAISTHFLSSKTMLSFVRLTYTVIRYVLFQAGLTDIINMQASRDQRELTEYDVKSQNSFTSARKSNIASSFKR